MLPLSQKAVDYKIDRRDNNKRKTTIRFLYPVIFLFLIIAGATSAMLLQEQRIPSLLITGVLAIFALLGYVIVQRFKNEMRKFQERCPIKFLAD